MVSKWTALMVTLGISYGILASKSKTKLYS